jgi:hypothetical protein
MILHDVTICQTLWHLISIASQECECPVHRDGRTRKARETWNAAQTYASSDDGRKGMWLHQSPTVADLVTIPVFVGFLNHWIVTHSFIQLMYSLRRRVPPRP